MNEPIATAWVLLTFALLLIVSVVSSRAAGRLGVPGALIVLIVGMLAGSEGIGGIAFEDYRLTFRLGTIALALILFDGGLQTRRSSLAGATGPAAVLATGGVLITAALVAVTGRLVGLSWAEAAVLGAVVSSTDAAAVYAVLRGSGVQLRRRVALTLEMESGLNDPLAMILTVFLSAVLVGQARVGAGMLLGLGLQIAVGLAGGLALGWGGAWLLKRARLLTPGLYPVLSIAIALLVFGAVTVAGGSGFLAVYLAGLVIGNSPIPHGSLLRRVHDALAWFCQVTMFLLLGLLAFPSRLIDVAGPGISVALVLVVVARPLAVIPCLLPFRFAWREVLFIAWVGLRGAVPIVLAAYPIMLGAPASRTLFNLVFFVVVVTALVPGATVRWLAARLELRSSAPPPPEAVLDIVAARPLGEDVLSFYIDQASAVAGTRIRDIPFPVDSAVMLVVRGSELLAPRGPTRLEVGDHVYVFARPVDRAFVALLFGQAHDD